MTPQDRQFVEELGRRVAEMRQQAGMRQQALADQLGIAQQTIAHYNVGRLRLPISLVPKLAQLVGAPTDEILGVPGVRTGRSGGSGRAGKRGPMPKLQQQLERIERLPKAKQKIILDMLDGVLLAHR